jgi:uncharacterized repeat protein (TIGR04042 family)
MPAMHFHIRWPDASHSRCYSPSTVILEHLQAGQAYALADFVARSRAGLNRASERVAQKFGYACSSALDQLSQIEQRALLFTAVADASVLVERIEPV